MSIKGLVVTVVLVLGSGGVAKMTAADQTPPRVAFFGFQLINTSLQPTTPEETQRIRMLERISAGLNRDSAAGLDG
jgi:hypothetical protein